MSNVLSKSGCPVNGRAVRYKLLYGSVWLTFACRAWIEKACN
uniref:Uncharacterized protein n=1 Tax=Rhizophora mucronata TaxID=61149 RepID=A0A2P2QXD0_RHIMU